MVFILFFFFFLIALQNGNKMDFIGRLETFEEHWQVIFERLVGAKMQVGADAAPPLPAAIVKAAVVERDALDARLAALLRGWGFELQHSLALYPFVCEFLVADFKCLAYNTADFRETFYCLEEE